MQLAERAPAGGQGRGLIELVWSEHAGARAPRNAEQPLQLARGALEQRDRTPPLGLANAVDLLERPVALLPQRSRLGRTHGARAPGLVLEPVRQACALVQARRSQPGQQVAVLAAR